MKKVLPFITVLCVCGAAIANSQLLTIPAGFQGEKKTLNVEAAQAAMNLAEELIVGVDCKDLNIDDIVRVESQLEEHSHTMKLETQQDKANKAILDIVSTKVTDALMKAVQCQRTRN